jgi:putative inorganic carbon (HCO3(-)) transporter
MWIVIALGVAWLAGHAVWVYHTQPLSHPQLTGGRLSSYGAYSGANDLALLVVCSWPIVYKFTDLSRNYLVKLLPLPLLLLLVYVELRTISRAGLLGLSIVMGLSLLRGRSLGRLGRWAIIVPAVIVVFIVGSKILLTRHDAQEFSARDQSMQHRLEAWYAGLQMFQSSPIWGVGSDKFPSLSREFGAGLTIQAHNTIVKVAAESGLIGLACYLGMLIVAFRSLWRSWKLLGRVKPDGPERLWAEALAISLVGFCFNTQFSVKAHEWLLYFVLASSFALERLALREAARFAVKVDAALELLGETGTKPA